MVLIVSSGCVILAHTISLSNYLSFTPNSDRKSSLQLIKHLRKRVLDRQGFLYFVGAEKRILAVFQEAWTLVVANELDEPFRIGLPVHGKALEIFKNGADAGRAEKCYGILGVLIKVGIEDALIHEVSLAVNWKQHPAQIMKLERRQQIGLSSQGLLDVLRVLIKDRLAAGNDFGDDRESVTGGGLRVDGTVLALFQMICLFGYCHRLRFDIHINAPYFLSARTRLHSPMKPGVSPLFISSDSENIFRLREVRY